MLAMTSRPRRFATLCAMVLLLGRSAIAEGSEKPTFWVVPHSHWEGAVFKTREQYLEMGLPNILKALRLMKTQPEFTFILDQVAYIRPFIERYPEEVPAFKKYLAEGRLQIAGGMDVMPDVNMPGGETTLRQIEYGKTYLKQALGIDVNCAWLVDTFGHNAQMPQILRHGGYDTFFFSRGVNRENFPAEFLWEGIDGTRIRSFFLPQSYVLLFAAPRDPANYNNYARQRWDVITPNSIPGGDRMGAVGGDVTEPEETTVAMVKLFNEQQKDAPFAMKMGTPRDYEQAHAHRKDLPVEKGEFNPIFQGTYSSRIELKRWMRSMEAKLTAAEKLAVLSSWVTGKPADSEMIWRAWEPVMFNETHDLSSGVMTNPVYEDTIRGYEFSNRLTDEMIDTALTSLIDHIDTRGEENAIPVVVFNPLGWVRSDVAEVLVGYGAADDVMNVSLIDADGGNIPVQVMEEQRYPNGALRQARLMFVARDVPTMGYAVYRVVPASGPAQPIPPAKPSEETMETDLYRLTFDSWSGAIKSLHVKDGDWEVFARPGNVVSREQDKGDLWELYQGLNGGQKIAVTRKQPVPKAGETTKISSNFKGKDAGTIRTGPVYSEFDVWHPFDTGDFSTRVRIYNGLPRIDIRTQLINKERLVRYQALFPTTLKSGSAWRAIPFGAIAQPDGVEFPAQDWTDWSDGKRGLAVLNVGQPGNVVSEGTMMLSLLRAHNLGAYAMGGGYEGQSADSGMQLGKQITLNYALRPHAGSWQDARVYRDGMEVNRPLIVRKAARHEGKLPAKWGMLEISAPNVVLSALKPARDGSVIVRVFESAGQKTNAVELKFASTVQSAELVNALEDVQGKLDSSSKSIKFDLHPFEISSIRVKLSPGEQGK
jgi:alpha-mannosidase